MEEELSVLFVYCDLSTFVERDLELLRRHFDVKTVRWRRGSGMLRSVVEIMQGMRRCDVSFTWFAGVYGAITVFFSKCLGKRSVVVVGGYDVAKVPELEYGAFTKSKEAIPARYCLKNATRILVVDESLKEDAVKNAKVIGGNIEYVPTGYDAGYWKPRGRKEMLALTVAIAHDIARARLKGLDTFVNAAQFLPEVRFVIVGVSGEVQTYLENMASQNVEVTGVITEGELLRHYQRARVYCQLSLREGLPNTLCEAMLCECIPVGTEGVGGISTAIGDSGFYAPYGAERTAAKAIKKALEAPENMGKEARMRIKNLFPTARREQSLVETIVEVVIG